MNSKDGDTVCTFMWTVDLEMCDMLVGKLVVE